MGYDGPAIHRAPFGNDAAQENFERTVLTGVDVETIDAETERELAGERVRLWGTKASVEGSWRGIEAGDFVIFYRDGEYEYAAEVLDTERNEALGREIWPNHEEGSPWICIIYLDEPVELGVDSAEIHELAGYEVDYTMGFSPLNEMGLGGVRGRWGSVEAFVHGGDAGDQQREVDIQTTPEVRVPESVLSDLYFPEDQAEEMLDQVNSALNAGKHVVFTGPPGTGKTEVARRVSQHLVNDHDDIYSGYEMTTATADWSTFETVGGYMPEENSEGDLAFQPGQVLRRFKRDGVQQNEPLVIDEINRADIDKSFGQLFTLLSGQGVQLPFTRDGEEIEILPAREFEGTPAAHQYVMPSSWRLFATMNSYDKTALYEMSYAFMRRFAFVHVDAPTIPEGEEAMLTREYAEVWGIDAEDALLADLGAVWRITNSTIDGRKLGPAIVKDMLAHVTNSQLPREAALTSAVTDYVFPQLEGVARREAIVSELADLDCLDRDRLVSLARDMLEVRLTAER